jgi:signal transduction histidine kinase
MLVPDPETALRVAKMAKQPVECYQMMSRLEVALQAIQDLRRVNYQIRQLRRVQGDLSLVECDIEAILNEEIRRARDSMPGVLITLLSETGTTLVADPQFLKEAFQEVFNNSLRELRARKTDNPAIEVHLRREPHQIHVKISDNGLPPLNNLIDQPFEEDASTYATQGQGSGLGLTMVREIMLRHGGSCSLRANVDDEGARLPGVTFLAILPNPKLPITPLLPL